MADKRYDWQTRLFDKVEELEAVPFLWGQDDCIIFAAKCVDAQRDDSHIADQVIGKYNCELGCKRYMLQTFKSADIRKAIDAYLGERIPVSHVQRGDVVTFEGDLGLTGGVYWSTGVWAMGPDGVVMFDLRSIRITDAWRV